MKMDHNNLKIKGFYANQLNSKKHVFCSQLSKVIIILPFYYHYNLIIYKSIQFRLIFFFFGVILILLVDKARC